LCTLITQLRKDKKIYNFFLLCESFFWAKRIFPRLKRTMGISPHKSKTGHVEISKIRLSVETSSLHKNRSAHPIVQHLREKYGHESSFASGPHFFYYPGGREEQFVLKDLPEILKSNLNLTRYEWRITANDRTSYSTIVVYILNMHTQDTFLCSFPEIEREIAYVPRTRQKEAENKEASREVSKEVSQSREVAAVIPELSKKTNSVSENQSENSLTPQPHASRGAKIRRSPPRKPSPKPTETFLELPPPRSTQITDVGDLCFVTKKGFLTPTLARSSKAQVKRFSFSFAPNPQ
jgi:hypothetical protein